MNIDLIWMIAAFLLTLMVFSYLLGDNFFYRLAIYLFIGVAAGYTAALVVRQLLVPRLFEPLFSSSMTERLLMVVPLLLGLLLAAKLSPRLSRLGSVSMAYLVGVGAAVVVGGAVLGTLIGQFNAALMPFDFSDPLQLDDPLYRLFEGSLMLAGTITTLVYFHFGVAVPPVSAGSKGESPHRRPRWLEFLAKIGQVFIGITLGSVFAGVYIAALTALLERLSFLVDTIRQILTMGGLI
jgi:hypothetical protein